MTRRTAQQHPSDDRTIPPFDPAVELEPNYFCRGRNIRRGKYCAARAGKGTTRPGVGRCKHHGGRQPKDGRVTHGATSLVRRDTLRDLIAQELERPDPLNLTEELATLRALRRNLFADDTVEPAAAQSLLDAAGRMVERIEKIRSQNAISRPELNRIMHEMWRAVDGRITDETIKGAIRDDWMRISL